MTMRGTPIPAGSTGPSLRATIDLLYEDILGSTEKMVREIQARVPEYAPSPDEPESRLLRAGIELALRRYIELVDQHIHPDGAGRDGHLVDWRELYRSAGANEMRAGRSLDGLHAAVRISARVANR